MDFQKLVETYFPLVKRHFLPLAFGLVGLIFFTYGLISLLGSQQAGSKDITFEAGSDTQTDTDETALVVDVEGAIVRPGVYKLSPDARIQEALIAAGGLSSKADRTWVAKSLNLASRLTDGAKIYIPAVGENISAVGNVLGVQSSGNNSGLININSASEKELDTLPGIGPVTAQKIISGRPYASIEDLLNKKIVGSKVFSEIKGKISIN